jgi:SAM-dependent MidA family methyltransferase
MPGLDAAQRAHAAAVRAGLLTTLAAHGGWLPFDAYLEHALYAPGLGYYSAGAAKIGAAGDFTTAPELSPLFGACVARQCAPLLREAGDLLELGAGTGALAATVLPRLEALGALPQHYYILEISADLRARQRQSLARLPPSLQARLHWLDALPEQPLRGAILANEVADALPFKCFAVRAGRYFERGVGMDAGGDLHWVERAASPELCAELARIGAALPQGWPTDYCSELCPRAASWLSGVAAALETGALLLFDYGLGRRELYHPQRDRGTLHCHYRHRAHGDPFLHPGLQDITAWVDFTRLAEAACDAGLEVAGYCTQAAFLIGAGIAVELEAATDPLERARRAAQARQLMMPGEMGENFKALALMRGDAACPSAFRVQDLRRLL